MEFQIPVQEIEILALIGNGSFGKVSKGRYNSEIVAIKQLHPQRYSEQAKISFRKEALLMKELGHPRVLVYRGYFENDQDIGIVMEYMENGSLLDAIERKLQFPQDTIISIAYDIASGMNYLHLKNILHHDLKSANVFLDRYNRAKVGDFGLSVIKNESSSKVANAAAGTMAYLGPECFGKNAIFAASSDVYAYSLVLWEIISWQIAYKDMDPYNVTVFIRDGQRLSIPPMDFGLGELIKKCWAQNRQTRPTFTEVLLELEPCLPAVTAGSINVGKAAPLIPLNAPQAKFEQQAEPVSIQGQVNESRSSNNPDSATNAQDEVKQLPKVPSPLPPTNVNQWLSGPQQPYQSRVFHAPGSNPTSPFQPQGFQTQNLGPHDGVFAYSLSPPAQPYQNQPPLNRDQTVVAHNTMHFDNPVKVGKESSSALILGKSMSFWLFVMVILFLFVIVGILLAILL